MDKVLFLDCTIRDGGYVNSWHFQSRDVRDLYNALCEAGIDFMEIGFRNKDELTYAEHLSGPWRNLVPSDVAKAVPVLGHTKLALMIDYANADPKLIPLRQHSMIEMIRVAFHKHEFRLALELCGTLKQLGYVVCANAMATINYSDLELAELSRLAAQQKIDFLYVADSYGSLVPDDITRIYNVIRQELDLNGGENVKVGAHLHDNLSNATANAIAALNCGYNIIDSTILGMGRGAGNLTSEGLAALPLQQTKRLKALPLLSLAQNVFSKYVKCYNVERLLHIIGAHYSTHPNYICKLIDMYILDVELAWQICSTLQAKNQNKLFKSSYLMDAISELTGDF